MKTIRNFCLKFVCCALTIAATLSAHAYDSRSGLLSYYPFDSSVTADAAFTNNFTATNAPVLITTNPAPRNSVLQLNGTSQCLLLNHPTDNLINGLPFYKAGRYTIAMWVKGPAQSGRYLLTDAEDKNASPIQPLFLIQTGTGGNTSKLDVLIRNDATTTYINHAVSSSVVFDNTWHHIAFIDDNGTVQLYIDGVLDANSSAFNHGGSGGYSFNRMALGALARPTPGSFFNGAVDDLSIWERPLTQAEVQNIMANGIVYPVPAMPPGLLVEPVSQIKHYQDAVTFSAVAVGTRPNNVIGYQWNLNNIPIPGATNRTYRVFNLTTLNSGETYSVTVTNAVGSVTSSNATLTVLADEPPDVRNDLVSFWPLDSMTNNNGVYSTIDTYARNDFTLFNMSEFNVVGGHFGNGLEFDNLGNTYALRSSGTPSYSTNGYSVSLWVYKPDGGAGVYQSDVRVFSESSTNNNTPLFTIGTTSAATNLAKIYIRNDANVELLNRASTRPVFDGVWHHLLWVDDNGQGRLYIDGVLDETDFTYTPAGTLTLNATSLGAIVRTTVGSGIFCDVDEVAVWSRALNYTEVQDVKDNGVPPPLAPTPPEIVTQPVGTNVFTKSTVNFSVAVTGLGPFGYQWFKGSSPLANATNATFTLSSVQLSDAGAYSVVITNAGGSTNSLDAVLVVTERPAPPTALAIDFSNRNQDSGNTEPGFDSFTLAGAGATTLHTTRLFGGVEVTVGGSAGTTVDSRLRGTPNPNIDFTQTLLLKDFVFSVPSTGTEGLDVVVRFMQPNQQYAVTIWSYDSGQPAGDRTSDWYANGELVKDNYTFNVSNPPTNNLQHQFSFYATTDADGQLLISGRRDNVASASTVFLNALKIAPATAPDIDKQPVGTDVFNGADVTFYVNAAGVGPFTYQWYKGANPINGATDRVLQLNNVALSAAGTYSVQIGNGVGTTNSAGAVLNVTPRPAPPATLAIDFNQRGEEAVNNQSGFDSFSLAGSGAIALPTTRLFGGVEVTVSGSNGTTVDSRSRTSITNSGAFTEELLLRDFVYSTPTTGNEGLDVRIRFLAPNQLYNCTIWSFDDQQATTNAQGLTIERTSDWYANGILVKDNYSFYGTTTNEPTDNLQYQFKFTATSDANGTILLQGRRDMTENVISVFLNALKIAVPQTVIGAVERVGGNLRVTIETPDSSQPHQLQSTDNLSNISWGTVSGVVTTILGPTTLQMEFPAPTGATGFYRVVRP